jgi:23S rRNA pseudouridine1911/1915/1917 synthase
MARYSVSLASGEAERVDRLLARAIDGISRRTAQRWLEQGRIRIDGRRARKGEWLRGDRTIEIQVVDEPPRHLLAEPERAVPVLFEDEHVVALDKPAGRPGHAVRADQRGTVANFIAARFPECIAAGATPLEAGLAHRLDTDTSGVLLAARRRDAWQALREQFAARTIGKHYLAVVHGAVAAPGEIARPIAGDPRSARRVRVLASGEAEANARPAITRYRPRAVAPGYTLLDIEITTGVRHQIRAHLAAIGHPIVGDPLYGGSGTESLRQCLHARALSFDHPAAGERITVTSPLPGDFTAALSTLGFEP